MLEPTRGEYVLEIVLSSQKGLVDNVKIHDPLGNSDHNQIHFDINVKSESKNKKNYRRNFHKGNYKDMRKYLAKLDLVEDIFSKVLKFADDTKEFRKVTNDTDKQSLQDDLDKSVKW